MQRHYCKHCNRKRTEAEMLNVLYRTLGKSFWLCREHASAFADISTQRTPHQKPVFVELFSGSGHIAAAASMRGFETLTVDIEPRFNPDICLDICNLRRSALPGRVDVIWASIPCTVYSVLNLESHWSKLCIGYRRYHYSPTTPEAIQALRILTATIRLIKQLKPLYFFIENPRGALRHMPHMAFVPFRRSVHYSDYGFDYPKPTDIFTNCWQFQPIHPTGPAVLNGASGVTSLNSAYQRALIPPALISYLLDCLAFLLPAATAENGGTARTAETCDAPAKSPNPCAPAR